MKIKFNDIIENYFKDLPSQVSLTLPKLKKVENDVSSPKITLPKLKKIGKDSQPSDVEILNKMDLDGGELKLPKLKKIEA